jgi:hypothetical protein
MKKLMSQSFLNTDAAYGNVKLTDFVNENNIKREDIVSIVYSTDSMRLYIFYYA